MDGPDTPMPDPQAESSESLDAGVSPDDAPRTHYIQQLAPWLLVLAGVCVYANSLSSEFILDSVEHINQNESIRQLWPPGTYLFRSNRPVVWASLAVNYAMGGVDPAGYHLFNLLIHVLAAVVLFAVVRRTLLLDRFENRFDTSAPWLALAIAMLWLVHPLNTQSVTYVIQRSESMMGLFYLLTLYGVIRSVDSSRPIAWLLLAGGVCALGVASKFTIVTVPAVILIYDWVFLRGQFVKLMKKQWLCSAALCVIVLVVLGYLTNWARQLFTGPSAGLGTQGVSPMAYLGTQSEIILHYLRLTFWPDALCLDYAWPPVESFTEVALPSVIVIAGLAATAWGVWKRSAFGFLSACFFLILAPTSSVIPLWDLAAEHRMYLPLAAVIIGVVMGAYLAGDALVRHKRLTGNAIIVIASVLLFAACVSLGARTYTRNRDYHDRLSMWLKIIRQRPNNIRAHNHSGVILTETGEYEQAIHHLRIAVERGSDKMANKAQINLARALVRNGQATEAIKHLTVALKARPKDALAHQTLAEAYRDVGKLEDAVKHYGRSVGLRPKNPVYRFTYGWMLLELDRDKDAAVQLRKAIEGGLSSSLQQSALGLALARLGEKDDAEKYYKKVIGQLDQRDPSYALTQKTLARLSDALGRSTEAQLHWYQTASVLANAMSIDPEHPQVIKTLTEVLIQLENRDPIIAALVAKKDDRPAWARALAQTAWQLWADPDPKQRPAKSIMSLARRADELSHGQDAHARVALAAALWAANHKEQADRIIEQLLADADLDERVKVKIRILNQIDGQLFNQPRGKNRSKPQTQQKTEPDNAP